jgi:DNA topoisomerase-1
LFFDFGDFMSAPARIPAPADLDLAPDPRRLARQAGLRYVSDSMPGYGRRRRGKGFSYHDEDGQLLKAEVHLARIEALVIPPAWEEVWVCPLPNGHLQATGRDEKGRKQYRYHDRWSRATNWAKFARLRAFGHALPEIRRRIRRDLNSDDDRTRTLALMAALLDATAIRVGNKEYAEENEHYGLTTLLDEHVTVRGDLIRFEYVGKSGKDRLVELHDRSLAKRVRALLGRKGSRLFEVKAEDGSLRPAEAEDLNAYLREMTPPGCTAKTFRTWRGTVIAFEVLAAACECQHDAFGDAAHRVAGANGKSGLSKKAIAKTLRESIKAAAELLGNTTTVCKAYYVHPALCDLYQDATLHGHLRKLRPKRLSGLKPAEQRLLALLDRVERL